MTGTLLTIDLGTSSTKLLLVDRAGAVIARRRLPHPTWHPEPDAAEQDSDIWWGNIVTGVAALRRELPGTAHIAAISVTGQMHGLVVHGPDDRPLRAAITWQDQRSAASLPTLQSLRPSEHPAIATGYQAATWHWLTQAEPEVAARATRVLLPKDEIVHRLTGVHVTDPSDAIGTGWYGIRDGCWETATIEASGARLDLLPTIVPAGSIAGALTARAAGELGLALGIPVIVAGGDAAVGAFGAGATACGTPLVMLSTGCQALDPLTAMPVASGWPSANPPGLPAWLRVATTPHGGNVVRWARGTFGDPGPDPDPGLICLPWRIGDEAGANSGAFIGLDKHHTPAAMCRAAIDGVSLALADAFARAGGRIAIDAPILVGGGGTLDADWLAGVANAFGRAVSAIAEPDLSAWGAARSAATTLGWIDPVASPTLWRPTTRRLVPLVAPEDALSRLERFRTAARHRSDNPEAH